MTWKTDVPLHADYSKLRQVFVILGRFKGSKTRRRWYEPRKPDRLKEDGPPSLANAATKTRLQRLWNYPAATVLIEFYFTLRLDRFDDLRCLPSPRQGRSICDRWHIYELWWPRCRLFGINISLTAGWNFWNIARNHLAIVDAFLTLDTFFRWRGSYTRSSISPGTDNYLKNDVFLTKMFETRVLRSWKFYRIVILVWPWMVRSNSGPG